MSTAIDTASTEPALPDWAQWALGHPGRSHRVPIEGVELHALCWGDEAADAGRKPPVLLVHGHRAHAHWWDFIAPFLAQTHRVYALDLSGMGDSGRRTVYPKEVGAVDIIGFVQAMQLRGLTVIGHSNGGLRALAAAGRAPDWFDHLVAIDSYPLFDDQIHPTEPEGLRGDRVYPDLETALSRYRLLPEQREACPWVVRHIARHSVRATEGGWTWKFDPDMPRGAGNEPDGPTLLSQVRCPVHYLHGGDSAIVSPELARRIVAHLPRGIGPIVIPGGGHHLMFDQPQALVGILQALLARRGDKP